MVVHRSLREKQRQEREDLILQAAEEVLLEKGYHDMAMDEIASRVGIAKGTLYLHFSRKEDLVYAIIERQMQELTGTIEQISARSGSAQERLTLMAEAIFGDMSGQRMQLLYALHNSIDFKNVMKERYGKSMDPIAQQLTRVLDEGKANGEFDATLPTLIMLHTFFCMLSPLAHRRLVVEQGMDLKDVLSEVSRIYFRGIGAECPAQRGL
jgi:AcrR family transcriptional regulator